jgi:predicted RNase H-like HicB family nuclease
MYRFLIIIERSKGNYSGYCPDLPGCIATGRTKLELKKRIRTAIALHIRGLIDEGLPIPVAQTYAEYLTLNKKAVLATSIRASGRNMKNELGKEVVRCTCGSWTSPKILKIEGLKIRGSVCPKCKETYLNGEDAMMLSRYRRQKDRVKRSSDRQ